MGKIGESEILKVRLSQILASQNCPMYVIDVVLRNNPIPLSVERKSEEDAQGLYAQILEAMRSSESEVIELKCDRQTEKTVALLSSEITAVQKAEKTGTTAASGRPPGFFAVTQ
ncbi:MULTISPECIES: hypothetical protein [unclassified Roseofilum]|nr:MULTISPECIES: hypothetical protein [unclassified Roseofilum]